MEEQNKVEVPNIKFLIFKMDELLSVCTQADLQKIDTIMDRILHKREAEGKSPVSSYIVVNADEPYAPQVREILKANNHWG